MPDIRAVVFDFGGVLFDWSAEYLYRELIPDDEERRWFLTHVCSPAWNLKQDGGRPIAEAEAELIALHPDHADLIRAFYGQWPKTLRGLLDDGVALLEQLHAAGVPLYGLTNWSAETYHHVEDKYDFMKRFRHVVVSGRIGMVKPDPRIYAHLLEHVRRAGGALRLHRRQRRRTPRRRRALGLHGITHRSGAETAARLRDARRGVLTRRIANTWHGKAHRSSSIGWRKAACATCRCPTCSTASPQYLLEGGVPIARAYFGMSTRHPLIQAFDMTWEPDSALYHTQFDHTWRRRSAWTDSPLRHMIMEHLPRMRRVLQGPQAVVDFPVLEELAERGFTDWYGAVSGFEADSILDQPGSLGMACSWSTDQPGGFSAENIALINRLFPIFAVSIKAAVLPIITRTLLGAYIGTDAAQRVWSGATNRGSIERVEAAIFFSDLRGFTAFAEQASSELVMATLNRYFDSVGAAIVKEGGEILKFMGDGILATFAQPDANVCEQALRAARTAVRDVAALAASSGEAGGLARPRHRPAQGRGAVRQCRHAGAARLHHDRPGGERGGAHGKADQEPGLRDPGLGFVPGGPGRKPAPAAAGGRARHLRPQRATRALRGGAGRQGGGVTIWGCRH